MNTALTSSSIKIGTKMVGKWGAMHPYSWGEVTAVHENGMIEVNFDDFDGFTLYRPDEIQQELLGSGSDVAEIGVFIEDLT